MLKEERFDLAREIFEDLYLGKHPLMDLFKEKEDGSIELDLEEIGSKMIENYVPSYFRQRLALMQLTKTKQRLSPQ